MDLVAICNSCGKIEPVFMNGTQGQMPESWLMRAAKELPWPLLACSAACMVMIEQEREEQGKSSWADVHAL